MSFSLPSLKKALQGTEKKHAFLAFMITEQLADLEEKNAITDSNHTTPPPWSNHPQATSMPSRSRFTVGRTAGFFGLSIVAVGALVYVSSSGQGSERTIAVEDTSKIVQHAIECDAEVDFALLANRESSIDDARQELGNAIAKLGTENSEHAQQLRRLQIPRLLQLGGSWCREAERQIVLLDEAAGNPDATKWMALALVGQLRSVESNHTNSKEYDQHSEFWLWLSNQKPGEALLKAIELNPMDVELLANLVEISEKHLDAFEFSGSNRDANRKLLRERVSQKLVAIELNEDSRSRLILHRFKLSDGNSSSLPESPVLSAGFKAAASRLEGQNYSAELVVEDPQNMWLDFSLPNKFWDYVLVKELAASTSSSTVASDCYHLLMRIESSWVPTFLREDMYLAAGNQFLALGDSNEAIRIWDSGIANTGSDSFRLIGAVADVTIKSDKAELSSEKMLGALKQFRSSIELTALRLANSPYSDELSADRRRSHREIQTARWNLNVLDAIYQTKLGHKRKAIDLLEAALASQPDVDRSERVDSLIRLAKLYEEQSASGNAAAALDRAISLEPSNMELRAQAAEVWGRVGDRQRANHHWQRVSRAEDAGLALKIMSLEALFESELSVPTAEQRFSKIRSAVEAVRKQIVDSEGDSNNEDWRGRLTILEFALPPNGVDIHTHLGSLELKDEIESLASELKENIAVQRFAADFFAAHDNQELAMAAIKRIESFAGKKSFAAVVAQARLEAAAGKIETACQRLHYHAKQYTVDSERAHLIASSWASQDGQHELAYKLLLTIPLSKRSAFILYSIANAAKQLPPDAQVVKDPNMSPFELAEFWKTKLKAMEGETGTWWKLLEATWLIDQLHNDPAAVSQDDPRLTKIKTLVSQLKTSRPYWNKVMSLEGAIFAAEQKPSQAIEHLKRAIASGDNRMQTHRLLNVQLELLSPSHPSPYQKNANQFSRPSSASVDIFLHAHACLREKLKDLPVRYVAERSFTNNWVIKAINDVKDTNLTRFN